MHSAALPLCCAYSGFRVWGLGFRGLGLRGLGFIMSLLQDRSVRALHLVRIMAIKIKVLL